ncbi:hypothetical protein [Catenulispora acidiphila]|nr:hypothetical protein [Catenulispora acidiphila]
MDALDEPQALLLELVWSQFEKAAQFPNFNWVEYQMRAKGYDAAEVIGGLPSIGKPEVRGRYSAIWTESAGSFPQPGNRVCLTMAGLYHTKDRSKTGGIISGVLFFLRTLSEARAQIANHPFDVPDIRVSLSETLSEVSDQAYVASVGMVAEHEWLAMQVHRTEADWTGRLALLNRADFMQIEDYLTAITAVCTEQRTAILTNRNPRALARSITNFDLACELVLKRSLVKKPAISRTVLLGQDATSHTDLVDGISALGILLHELDVPKTRQDPPCGSKRLQPYLEAELPNIDKSRVESATALMDAVRIIRNSDQHPARVAELVSAYELLGLAFPVRDPTAAWDIIRAQMDAAFNTLQDEILAART